MSTGASASASFVSCISRTSGFARASHQATLSSRARSELTFQVAIRMLYVLPMREFRGGAARTPGPSRSPRGSPAASTAHAGPAGEGLRHILRVDERDIPPRRALQGGHGRACIDRLGDGSAVEGRPQEPGYPGIPGPNGVDDRDRPARTRLVELTAVDGEGS